MTTIINVNTTGIVESVDTSGALQIQTGGVAAISIDTAQNVVFNSTGALTLNSGNTAQRPSTPVNGMLRYNTDFGGLVEGYANNNWVALTGVYTYSATYLVVAGGGGGISGYGGGGGGGGALTGTQSLAVGTTYPVVVGGAGAVGASGSNSSVASITATGGSPATSSYGGGNSGNGFTGGGGSDPYAGGGAGSAQNGGGAVAGTRGGDGGNGIASSITGTSINYAGGAAGYRQGFGGTGGSGGAGSGTYGGGGDGYNPNAGNAGVVILSVPTASYSGTTTGSPTVTINGANTVLTFTSSGSYTA